MRRIVCAVMTATVFTTFASAFNGNVAEEGPLTLVIGAIETVTEYDAPREVAVTLKNAGTAPLEVRLELKDLVDEWRAIGETQRRVAVAPGKEAMASFSIVAKKGKPPVPAAAVARPEQAERFGGGPYSALYPVHVYATFSLDGQDKTAHAVQVFEARFAKAQAPQAGAPKMPVNVLSENGTLVLSGKATQRVAWHYFDKPVVYEQAGWQGTDPYSSANFARRKETRGGVAKDAIAMHPPYKPEAGTIFAEYLIRLPKTTPIVLTFANAIRDNRPDEPPSDGVTFRVWAGEEKLFERTTDAKVWTPGQADLSRFAGREILLRLESHPGPARNTTCDSSFWAEPTLAAGTPRSALSRAERDRLAARARQSVVVKQPQGEKAFVFGLADGNAAAVVLGPNGLADAAIAFGVGERSVVFDGLAIAVLGREVGSERSQLAALGVKAEKDNSGRLRVSHRLALEEGECELAAEIWADGPALRIKVTCPSRITDLSEGAADQKAARVYYGHGYCIAAPKAFKANAGGHNLATSHVGFDFDNGVSLLMASDTPPDSLEVEPARNLYALHVHTGATLTFLPGTRGAFDCAIRYRPLYDKKPADGVARKAGRFVFDVWGGRYSETADAMERAFAYGLTDSMLLIHSWQRWGYDYRLPDIYPPNPQMGTVQDMRRVSEVCRQRDVPWGLHDNYIDFYPDATGYSYDHLCFNENGEPAKAWINLGRDAQSYRWRPDQFMPFLQRNLRQIKEGVAPTAYFLDVFSASGGFDYYDREGILHTKPETLRKWGEAFAYIRDTLGGNAPTSSEAGGDHLIGYLDGADCQHLRLTTESLQHTNRVDAADWERVPWFDAVNHARFILHGVGYSVRYQGERSRAAHGIESDDYLSDEILLGHALMIDREAIGREAMGRGAVRKYWLAQDFIRSVALDEITNVEFAGSDIHRQIVSWKSGARVWVNRGATDWTVEGRTLPEYGYLAKNGEIESAIERIGGVIVEQSRAPGRFYVNGRGFNPDAPLRLCPSAGKVEYLGGRKFKMTVNWDAEAPASGDLSVSLDFAKPVASRLKVESFRSQYSPRPGTSSWKGRVTTNGEQIVEIPEKCAPGRYHILVGMTDPKTKRRYALPADEFDNKRYRIGALVVEGPKNGEITGVRLDTSDARPAPPSRFNDVNAPIDFGPAVTAGAFRCETKSGKIIVTPLPGGEPFAVTLNLASAPFVGKPSRAKSVQSVQRLDQNGQPLGETPFQQKNGAASFETAGGAFAYQVNLE